MSVDAPVKTLSEAVELLQGSFAADDTEAAGVSFSGVCTDTRELKPGQLFVALVGPSFDGHGFVASAQQKGAAGVVISHALKDDDSSPETTITTSGIPQIIVADTQRAFAQLAGNWRSQFDIPVIAITGSNGKTTVKEIVAAIFAQKGEVLATQANFNNEIGVPRTLLRINEKHVVAVVEEGASHPGDIAYLTEFVQPTVALVTNAAGAHLEGFGSVEMVAKTKGEIFEGLADNAVAVINADDEFSALWQSQAGNRTVVRFGMNSDADVRGELGDDGMLHISTANGDCVARWSLEGQHNVMNALAATAAALAAGASLNEVMAGLESVVPVSGRLESKAAINNAEVLDDTYNANPASLNVALDVLAERKNTCYLALGDMAELGDESVEFHKQAGERAREKGVQRLYAIGEYSRYAALAFGENGQHFPVQEELISQLREDLHKDVTLLVKGSRSAHMENVVAALVTTHSAAGGVN